MIKGFYNIEYIPMNTPAKILFNPTIVSAWFMKILFRGLVEDHFESIIKSATRLKAFNDVRSLKYIMKGNSAVIQVGPQKAITQFVPRHTASQRMKQFVRDEQEKERATIEKEELEQEISADVVRSLRTLYTISAIESAIRLHIARMRERHFILP